MGDIYKSHYNFNYKFIITNENEKYVQGFIFNEKYVKAELKTIKKDVFFECFDKVNKLIEEKYYEYRN